MALFTGKYGAANKPLTTIVSVTKLASSEAMFEIETISSAGNVSRPWSLDRYIIHKLSIGAVSTPTVETEVIVVGVGFSGVMAVYELNQAGTQSFFFLWCGGS